MSFGVGVRNTSTRVGNKYASRSKSCVWELAIVTVHWLGGSYHKNDPGVQHPDMCWQQIRVLVTKFSVVHDSRPSETCTKKFVCGHSEHWFSSYTTSSLSFYMQYLGLMQILAPRNDSYNSRTNARNNTTV